MADLPDRRISLPIFNEAKPKRQRKTDPFYNSTRWRSLSKFLLNDGIFCEVCGDLGDDVDHIIPWQDGGAKYDAENLQILCKSCHGIKTNRDIRRRK